jgi:Zn-dependent membrane protease YugP
VWEFVRYFLFGNWDYMGLVLLSAALGIVASTAYDRVRKRVDDKVPDDLREGGGSWVLSEIERRDLGIRVLVAPSEEGEVDAYMPSAKTILLSRETFEKHDASFWAVAAHELGHALVHGRARLVDAVFSLARALHQGALSLAMFLVSANLLYARQDITALAHHVLILSLGARALVLVDEALASTIALRILAVDRAISRPAWIGALTTLLAAFMTYLAGFVGQIFLVLRWSLISERIDARRVTCELDAHAVGCFKPAPPLDLARWVVVVTFAVALAVLSVREIGRIVHRPVFATSDAGKKWFSRIAWQSSTGALFSMGIVAIAWDQPRGPWFPLVCILGLVASHALIIFPLIVVALLLLPVFLLAVALLAKPLGLLIGLLRRLFVGSRARRAPRRSGRASPSRRCCSTTTSGRRGTCSRGSSGGPCCGSSSWPRSSFASRAGLVDVDAVADPEIVVLVEEGGQPASSPASGA